MLRKLTLVSSLALISAGARAAPSGEVNVTRDLHHRYGEVQIAVNPRNPANIVYADVQLALTSACQAAKDPDCEEVPTKMAGGIEMTQPRGFFTRPSEFTVVGLFYTVDGGATWHRTTVPMPSKAHPKLRGWGDPSVAVGPDGTFYLSFDSMDWGTPENVLPAGGIGVSKSTDGGRTWSSPVLSGTPIDGPKSVVDPNTGRLYTASSSSLGPNASGDPTTPRGTVSDRWLVSSTDGVHFTKPHGIGGMAHMAAAHGVLAAAFTTGGASPFGGANNALCAPEPGPCTIFETTTDSGATWTRHKVPTGPGAGQAMVAADPSRAGHFAVAVAVDHGKAYQVYETRDSGTTWSDPATVAEQGGKPHLYPWLAYGPGGVLGLMWRTSEIQAAGATPPPAPAPVQPGRRMSFGQAKPMPYTVWAAIARDGGRSFSAPLQISQGTSPAGPPGASGDDYSGLTLDRTHVYVAWPDWRPGERQGYFRAVPFTAFR